MRRLKDGFEAGEVSFVTLSFCFESGVQSLGFHELTA